MRSSAEPWNMGWPDSLPSREQRQACAQSGAKGYVRCRGDKMGLVSEAYGQGNTLATPVGVAGLLSVSTAPTALTPW